MTNLGPQFHGTAADLHPGDKVLPANDAGVMSHWGKHPAPEGKKVRDFAYATTDEETAWRFAEHAAGSTGKRGSVLRVNPHPEQKPGLFNPEHPDHGKRIFEEIPGETTAPHYDVVERHDVMPGRQGTLPVNWRQFGKKDSWRTPPESLNHPYDQDVELGHDAWTDHPGKWHKVSWMAETQAEDAAKQYHEELEDHPRLF